jgi:protein-tyrosine phosphatase
MGWSTKEAVTTVLTSDEDDSRTLTIDGVLNARDLGGMTGSRGPLRRGLLLRSACLNELTPAGARHLAGIGLRTVIDLRTPLERREEPNRVAGVPELAGVREISIELVATLIDLPDTSEELYRHFVEHCGSGITAVFEELARPGALPALVHCMVGKDRTGLTVALLLELLGVDRPSILADYVASNAGLGDVAHTKVRADVMAGVLAELDDTYGGARGYLVRHGLTEETISTLRASLLTRPAAQDDR